MRLKWLVEKARYLTLIGVFGLLIGAVVSFLFGLYKTYRTIAETASSYAADDFELVLLLGSLDGYLIAVALLVIAVSLYELFIGDLDVPDWMLVDDLSELKAKFAFVIVPIIAVEFLQKLLEAEDALETLYYGIAVAVVSLALTIFNFVGEKEKLDELKMRSHEAKDNEKRAEDVS